MGPGSIFTPKVNDKAHRVQGILTDEGLQDFTNGRARLKQLYRAIMGRDAVRVSQADTFEFLSRGELKAVKYLRRKKRDETRDA